jgi:hypothetical protein
VELADVNTIESYTRSELYHLPPVYELCWVLWSCDAKLIWKSLILAYLLHYLLKQKPIFENRMPIFTNLRNSE